MGKWVGMTLDCPNCGGNEHYKLEHVYYGENVVILFGNCWECGKLHIYHTVNNEPYTIHHDSYEMWMITPNGDKITLIWVESVNLWMEL